MDFRTELSKWGYNKGNSIDVEILVNEILPSLFSQQQGYSEGEVYGILMKFFLEEDRKRMVNPMMVEQWFKQFKKKQDDSSGVVSK